ncbi:MAG: hypothetical protein V1859_02450 [archaeon]
MDAIIKEGDILFLDTGVIFGYAAENDTFSTICKDFFFTYKNKMITCKYITDKELPKLLERRRILREEVRIKLWDSSFQIGRSPKLKQRDIDIGNKLCKLKNQQGMTAEKIYSMLHKIDTTIEQRVKFILDNHISESVLLIEKINIKLRDHIHAGLGNFDDANIMASALQHNSVSALKVITTDNNDWPKVHEIMKTYKEKCDVPEIYYIKDLKIEKIS